MKTVDPAAFKRVHGNTGFNPLPKEERGQDADGGMCCCPYCSPEPMKSRPNPNGVWDTLATDMTTGRTWKVHYPELHGRRRKRSSEAAR